MSDLRPMGLGWSILAAGAVALLPSVLAGCSSDDTGSQDSYDTQFSSLEGTGKACGMLRLVNESTVQTLDVAVGLDSRAAKNIVAYRSGPDGVAGTRDDQRFDSIAELDAVPWVGTSALKKVLKYTEATGLECTSLDIQILMLADWHGGLDSVSGANNSKLGGAATLSAYFQADRAANPNTLVLFAGDSYGASPPLASYFQDNPVVEAMNLMGVDADALGNHSFDRGFADVASHAELAHYPFVAANLDNVDANMSCGDKADDSCVEPETTFWVGGVKVGVAGLLTTDTASMVKPGALGTIVVTDPVAAAKDAHDALAGHHAQVFVADAHMGVTAPQGEPVGPLADLAKSATGYDVYLGGHTHIEYSGAIGSSLLVQTASGGARYARIKVRYDFASQSVVDRTAEFVNADANAMAPDQGVVDLLAPYRSQLAAAFDGPIGTVSEVFQRGNNVERLGEVPIGDLLADSVRLKYGVQIGFVNGGGIRAPLPSSYLPQDHNLRRPVDGFAAGPPYDLVVGDAYAVLPFGNLAVTRTVTGAQLWAMTEHGLSSLPAAAGFFGQVSGIRVRFNSTHPAGSRVVSITLDDGTAVAADDTSYTLATSDFLSGGGDGYTMLAGGDGVLRDNMAEVFGAYITGLGTVSPPQGGRLVDEAAP